jgi:hypothetical protein
MLAVAEVVHLQQETQQPAESAETAELELLHLLQDHQ